MYISLLHNTHHSTTIIKGEIDDDDECISDDKDWNAYWRLLFKPITQKDIKEFERKHKGNITSNLYICMYLADQLHIYFHFNNMSLFQLNEHIYVYII